MIEKKDQKLIYLKWQDAHANSSWMTEDELKTKIKEEACICEEVGWIVYEDKKEIHICARRLAWRKEPYKGDGFSEYGMYQRIPKTWILKRKILKV